jgi:hypothetical protein
MDMWGLFISLTLAILIVVIGGCAGKQKACLEVFGEEPETVLVRLPIEPGAPFTLEFINSIYLAPVRETLVYNPSEGTSIVMVESPSDGVFEYYGIEPDGTGRARMNRRVGDIKLRSHDYGNHRITVGGQMLKLNGLVPNGEPIFMRIRVSAECGM